MFHNWPSSWALINSFNQCDWLLFAALVDYFGNQRFKTTFWVILIDVEPRTAREGDVPQQMIHLVTQRSSVGTQSGGGRGGGLGWTVAPCVTPLPSARCGLTPSHTANFCTRLRKGFSGGSEQGNHPALQNPAGSDLLACPDSSGSGPGATAVRQPGGRRWVDLPRAGRSARVRCCCGILLGPKIPLYALSKSSCGQQPVYLQETL